MLTSRNGMAGDVQSAEQVFKTAIRKFQEFAGLAKTGLLDEATKLKMTLSRCGVTDAPLALTSGSSSQFKWPKTKLTYSIESFSSDLAKDDVRRAIAEAYSLWAKVTPLEFSEVPAGSNSDIKIRFGVRNHNDPWPFDGEGGVLAHATMPESGMFHFDDDENWTYKNALKISKNEATDLLPVAIHEGGHTLGLEHSRDEKAIMAPFYQKTTDANGNYVYPNLKADDIQAIQAIYGAGSGRSSSGSDFGGGSGGFVTTQRATTTTKSWFGRFFGNNDDDDVRSRTTATTRRTTLWPTTQSPFSGSDWGSGGGSTGRCPSSIDAYSPSDSFSYAFSGSQVYVISGTKVTKVQQIHDLFPSAPTPVSAAMFNPISGSMLLFSSNRVYSYYFSRIRAIYQMDSGFPKTLPSDLGFSVSGALRWINGHQILLSSGDEFAVYDEFWNQVTLKNRVSSYFPNLPRGVKGVESPAGSVITAFTSNQVVEYNSRTKSIGRQSGFSSYISC
uniref:ZnMc domain-containing protein n=1 Tax=Caenorhabditis japonica TaxID=281687 RepID=A0A8R1HVT3_CAEJA